GRRLFELADAEPAVREPAAPVPLPARYDLSVRDVSFRYEPGAELALRGVSFDLPEGWRVAVVGPSGAGKSTLANLLLRFWEPDAGRISLGGVDVRDLAPDDARRAFGMIQQDTHLFNATLRDNLLMARPDATEAVMIDAARRAQIQDFIQ